MSAFTSTVQSWRDESPASVVALWTTVSIAKIISVAVREYEGPERVRRTAEGVATVAGGVILLAPLLNKISGKR